MEKQSGVMALPQTMYGVQLIGHGGPDQLVWNETIPVPLPRPGEVLVRVLAAGVNNTDINTRIGWYSKDVIGATADVGDEAIESGGWAGALPFPLIQGGDLCGEVVLLGKGVTEFKPGMRVTCPINQPNPTEDAPRRLEVLGSDLDGTFAQFCKVPARQLFDVSSSPLSDIEIGAMPCAYGTALTLLTRSRVAAEDRVLITGASGGVGLAAVQLAKLKGAKVTGVSSPAKADSVLAAGGCCRDRARANPHCTGLYGGDRRGWWQWLWCTAGGADTRWALCDRRCYCRADCRNGSAHGLSAGPDDIRLYLPAERGIRRSYQPDQPRLGVAVDFQDL